MNFLRSESGEHIVLVSKIVLGTLAIVGFMALIAFYTPAWFHKKPVTENLKQTVKEIEATKKAATAKKEKPAIVMYDTREMMKAAMTPEQWAEYEKIEKEQEAKKRLLMTEAK